jgi:PPOX class probable FMN-dependent enzyme
MDNLNIFEHSISSESELRKFIGTPHEAVVKKSIARMDEHCRNFISMSPLLFLSTCNEEGKCDVSPRGDHPGFVYIVDDYHLIIPDRPGNRRVDSMLNILSNPHVGLVFLIPGMEEVLRINGRACVIRTADISEKLQLSGEPPLLGIGVEVEECFIHCSRALKKSNVWKVDEWPPKQNLPSATQMFHAHLKLNGMTLEE